MPAASAPGPDPSASVACSFESPRGLQTLSSARILPGIPSLLLLGNQAQVAPPASLPIRHSSRVRTASGSAENKVPDCRQAPCPGMTREILRNKSCDLPLPRPSPASRLVGNQKRTRRLPWRSENSAAQASPKSRPQRFPSAARSFRNALDDFDSHACEPTRCTRLRQQKFQAVLIPAESCQFSNYFPVADC